MLVTTPGTKLPVVVNVLPVKTPDDTVAKLPGLTLCELEVVVPAAALPPLPSALATATGRLVRPGGTAEAAVTNCRAGVASVSAAAAVGAAITDVETAFAFPFGFALLPAVQGAVTVTWYHHQQGKLWTEQGKKLTVMTVKG